MASRSENLAHHHCGHSGEHRDAKSGQGVLALSNSNGCDHTGTKAGHAELADDVVRAAHRDRNDLIDRREIICDELDKTSRSLPGVRVRYLSQWKLVALCRWMPTA